MFIPSFGEILIILIVAIIFFKTEDWVKIFGKWREFKNFIIKFKNNSQAKILEEIYEIEKEILKTKILKDYKNDQDNDEISHKIFEIGSKKYIYGIDGNLHEVFDVKKSSEIKNDEQK